jgi:predicted RNase H-like HicB family nuclease
MKKFLVIAQWDEEAGMWVATSDDIPGLVTEAKTVDDLLERVRAVAPELIEDNLNGNNGIDELLELWVQSSFSLQSAHAH